MDAWWERDPTGLIVAVPPSRWQFPPGRWDAVEEYLETALPSDYKELIGDGGAMVFDDELLIVSPFDTKPAHNLVVHAAGEAWGLAYGHDQDPKYLPHRPFPIASGLLSWGSDGGGGIYYWVTAGAPDQWTVCVGGRPVVPAEEHPMGMRRYLASLADGSVPAAALDGWPSQNPVFRRTGSVSPGL